MTQSPKQIAQSILDKHYIKHNWKRNGEQIEELIVEAITLDRASRIDGQTTIPTEDEWEESERKRLGLTAEEWAELTVDEDWGNPRPVIVMWGDSQETPRQRLHRFHEEILDISGERADREERIREALRALNEEVGS